MGSKSKENRLDQKVFWETELNRRLEILAESGIESSAIVKDTAVKKLRAKLRKTDGRLRVISKAEEKVEEMAQLKAEKLAAPKPEKSNKKKDIEDATTDSKRQQKKKKKKESKEVGQNEG